MIIRPSALSSYSDCPRRTAARLFRPLIENAGFKLRRCERNIASAIGTATHAATASYLKQKIILDEMPASAVKDACDIGVDALGNEIEHGAVWDKLSPSLNTAQKQVLRQAKTYIYHVGHVLQPVLVEERMEAKVGPFTLSGQPDVMTDAVHDTKTGVKPRNNAAQLGAYSLLMRSHGHAVNGTIEDFVQRVPLTKDQPIPVRVEYDHALAENTAKLVIHRIIADHDAFVASGDPEKILANSNSMLCSPKYCDAAHTNFCKHCGSK